MSDDWKAVPASPSELIRVGGTNFFNMRSIGDLQAAEASAPMFHQRVLAALKAQGKVRDDGTHSDALLSATSRVDSRIMKNFGKGAKVYDRSEGKRGIIIHAKAGHTRKTNTPVHRVADTSGNSWLAKETDLKLLL